MLISKRAMHPHTFTYILYMHAYIYTYIHTYMHTYIHTYTLGPEAFSIQQTSKGKFLIKYALRDDTLHIPIPCDAFRFGLALSAGLVLKSGSGVYTYQCFRVDFWRNLLYP